MAIGHRNRLGIAAMAAAALLATAPAEAQNYSDGYKFLQAVDKQDGAQVEQLLNKSSTIVNTRDLSDGHTALETSIRKHANTWVSFLLGKGADPNLADNKGLTPMMLASQLGYVDLVLMLASAGAKVDETNDTGETPLIYAVHARNIPMIRALLTAGADADRADNSGRTARDYATLEGRDSLTLAEITAHDKDKTRRKPGQTYGPTL